MHGGTARGLAKAPVTRARLPVSGLEVAWRKPRGIEDAMLAEGRPDDPALALELVRGVVLDSNVVDLGALPIPDIDALVAQIRRSLLGDRVVADVVCGHSECRQKIDLAFSLAGYLEHHLPKTRAHRGCVPDDESPGWFVFPGGDVAFRLPTFDDLIAASGTGDPAEALASRCLRPERPAAKARRRAERAMEAMAPALGGPLDGTCAECGAPIEARFEARIYCMQELCDRARFVYDDVDAIAARHHWSEAAILDLPSERRVHYAERARQAHAGSI